MVCNLPGSSVRGILQTRLRGWVSIPVSRDLPNPGIELRCPTLQADSLPSGPPGEPKYTGVGSLSLLPWIFLVQESNQGLLQGIQASIGTAEYIGGDTENLDDGLTWNAGAFITLPLSDYFFNVELGAQFIYRKVSASYTYENRVTRRDEARKDKVTSYTLGFPFLVNINAGKSGLINFSVGLEVETPLYNHLVISTNGKKGTDIDIANVKENDANYCEPISVDFVFGIGINATKNFGIYTRINAGITEIYDDVYLDPETRDINDQDREKGEYWSFTALDIAFGFRLYL